MSAMRNNKLVTVVLAASGAGCGAIAAQVVGVASWLDARLYIAAGAALGLCLSKLILSR